MKKKLIISIVLMATSTFGFQRVAADDFKDVITVVEKYFSGTEDGRPDLLKEAFLPSLEIQSVGIDGSLRRTTAENYIGRFQVGKKANRKGRVVSVDVTGAAASVKAEIVMGERLYTDYLLLLKLADGWRLTNKISTWRQK